MTQSALSISLTENAVALRAQLEKDFRKKVIKTIRDIVGSPTHVALGRLRCEKRKGDQYLGGYSMKFYDCSSELAALVKVELAKLSPYLIVTPITTIPKHGCWKIWSFTVTKATVIG